MIAVAMHRGLRERQLGRDGMPGIGRPHWLTAIPSSHGCDDLQDIGNRYAPRIAFHDKVMGAVCTPSGSTTSTHRASDHPLFRKI